MSWNRHDQAYRSILEVVSVVVILSHPYRIAVAFGGDGLDLYGDDCVICETTQCQLPFLRRGCIRNR